ncbi:unnamed protein product [Parnassius apollo]|uniref:(apollo) hypothetical protein n=1 Tax=Parnassius apollo TaxID=110799 RepID=A0A8S3XNQ3_PARAO|nr:unnamed protein product [Parnassius apollo]
MASSLSWNNEKIINFIDAVRLHPCLWDNKSPDFKDRLLKKDEWTAIGLQFEISHNEAVKKFKNLRTYFNNEIKKLEKKQKSGSGAFQESNWFAFKSLLFLKGTDEADSGLETKTKSEVDTNADDTITFNPELPPPSKSPSAKKKKPIEDDRCRDACEVMEAVKQKISTKSLAFGEHVNQKLLTYSQYVRNQVEYKISSILYEADMGYYDERSRSNVSGKQYSSSPSVSSSYRQRVYSPAPSPLSHHAIPTPSPTSVYEASKSSD